MPRWNTSSDATRGTELDTGATRANSGNRGAANTCHLDLHRKIGQLQVERDFLEFFYSIKKEGTPASFRLKTARSMISPERETKGRPRVGAGFVLLAVYILAHADAALALDQQAFGQRVGLDRQ